eukprot:g3406.t1
MSPSEVDRVEGSPRKAASPMPTASNGRSSNQYLERDDSLPPTSKRGRDRSGSVDDGSARGSDKKKQKRKKKKKKKTQKLLEAVSGSVAGGMAAEASDTASPAPAAAPAAATAVAPAAPAAPAGSGSAGATTGREAAPGDHLPAGAAAAELTGRAKKENGSQPAATAGAAGTVSPPKERRRLGKTHGRARKGGDGNNPAGASGPAGGRRREGAADDARPVLTPGGPGQGKPRKHTLSIAIPGSVVDNAQSRELKTYLVGEIARAAAIFEVDEIVVYDDLSVSRKGQGGVRDDSASVGAPGAFNAASTTGSGGSGSGGDRNNPNVFMARLLQYAETPQYLRKQLFPMHSSLRLAGLLNPLDAPHHMRADDLCPFREGVVLDKTIKKGAGSFVDIGKRKEARIDRPLDPGVRVTVKLDKGDPCKKNHKGRAVPPSAPREELGLYWGYQTRLASGMADLLAGCPYKGGYDLTVGTSERGTVTVDSSEFALPKYRHALVVFGGVQGIEATVDADESLQLPGSESSALFDMWVNTCPGQGSRTIRTEEAVLITLARLRPHVLGNGAD